MKLKLFTKRLCHRPTILGLVLIFLTVGIVIRLIMPYIYTFLFLKDTIQSKTLILEGWVPTYALNDAIDFYNDNNYEHLIVTGIPITQYEYASEFNYTSQATMLALKHFGFTDTIYEAANPTTVYKDRTYCTGLMAEKIFNENPEWDRSFNVYSMGVHSRRSKLLFKKAFDDDFKIGINAHDDRAFIGEEWWKSSLGFRNVSNELLALVYAKFFFHPDKEKYENQLNEGGFLDKHIIARQKKQFDFIDTTITRFNAEEIANHISFKYYDIDESYNVKATFQVDTSYDVFEMPTTTERKPLYRIYGFLDFSIGDSIYRLTAYQNMSYKDHPEHGKYLFIPFTDLSNGKKTYGGGRYMDILIPENEAIELDFNTAYNPYCAYSKRWSCPLVPFENHLNIEIKAGEKKYK